MSDSDSDSDFDQYIPIPPLQSSKTKESGSKRQRGPRDSLAIGLASPGGGNELKVVEAWRKVRWSTSEAVRDPSEENVQVWKDLEAFIRKYHKALSANTNRRDELVQWLGPDCVQMSFTQRMELVDEMVDFHSREKTHWNLRHKSRETTKEREARERKLEENKRKGKKMLEAHLKEVQRIVALLHPEPEESPQSQSQSNPPAGWI